MVQRGPDQGAGWAGNGLAAWRAAHYLCRALTGPRNARGPRSLSSSRFRNRARNALEAVICDAEIQNSAWLQPGDAKTKRWEKLMEAAVRNCKGLIWGTGRRFGWLPVNLSRWETAQRVSSLPWMRSRSGLVVEVWVVVACMHDMAVILRQFAPRTLAAGVHAAPAGAGGRAARWFPEPGASPLLHGPGPRVIAAVPIPHDGDGTGGGRSVELSGFRRAAAVAHNPAMCTGPDGELSVASVESGAFSSSPSGSSPGGSTSTGAGTAAPVAASGECTSRAAALSELDKYTEAAAGCEAPATVACPEPENHHDSSDGVETELQRLRVAAQQTDSILELLAAKYGCSDGNQAPRWVCAGQLLRAALQQSAGRPLSGHA